MFMLTLKTYLLLKKFKIVDSVLYLNIYGLVWKFIIWVTIFGQLLYKCMFMWKSSDSYRQVSPKRRKEHIFLWLHIMSWIGKTLLIPCPLHCASPPGCEKSQKDVRQSRCLTTNLATSEFENEARKVTPEDRLPVGVSWRYAAFRFG